jgi:hypothetical protein
LKKFSTYDLLKANKQLATLTVISSSKDNNPKLNTQFRVKSENRCKICNEITRITCVNCGIGVCVEHWDIHRAQVHMKGISLRTVFKEATAVHDGLDFKTCLKYMFKRL